MKIALPIFIGILLGSCQSEPSSPTSTPSAPDSQTRVHQHQEWNEWLESFGLDGVILLADRQGTTVHCSDTSKRSMLAPPASTFKVVLALVALQTHVLSDVDSVMLRQGEQDSNPKGMSDQSLREGMRNSTNWIFRRLAGSIGKPRLTEWMKRINYPAEPTESEQFWVDPEFQVTPQAQMELFMRLMRGGLPMEDLAVQKTQSILCMYDTLGMKLYAKTGWCEPHGGNVGWYIGSVVSTGDTCYFATCLRTQGEAPADFGELRKSLTYKALNEVGWMPQEY